MNDCWAGGYGHCRLAGTLKLAVGGGGPMCWDVLIEHYPPTGVKGAMGVKGTMGVTNPAWALTPLAN